MADRRILLADDSPTIQKVVNLTFADEGIDVVCASDGDAAYEMVSQFTPDLVLADVNMPGRSGYELCQALRDREETRQTPVILLVGSFEPFDEEKALQVGANDYLTKPFQSIRQLVATVSGLIGKVEPDHHDQETAAEETSVEQDVADMGSTYSDGPEPDDIDDLYRQSLHETVELPRTQSPDYSNLGDPGLDDELIETEVAESIRHDDDVQLSSETSDILEPIDTSDFNTETQFDSSDEIRFEDTIRDEFPAPPAEPAYEPPSSLNGSAPSETRAGDLHLVAPSNLSEEVTREFEIVESPIPSIPETGSVPPVEMDEAASAGEYPEVNVLDLPESAPAEKIDPPISEPASFQPFSPEMIDHLADKVAERVAQSLARQLAHLVVPDVVRMIEEDRKRDS